MILIGDMINAGAQRVVFNSAKYLNKESIFDIKVFIVNKNNDSYYTELMKQENIKFEHLLEKKVKIRIPYITRKITISKQKKAIDIAIKQFKPDIVHVHISQLLKIALDPIVKNNVQVRFDTLHSNPLRYKGKELKIIKKAFNEYNFIPICLTEDQAQIAQKHYGFSKYEIIRNGLEFNNIKSKIVDKKVARKLLKIDNEKYVVACVGRLDLIKRYDFIINVLSKIENDNVILIIAGDGPELNNLKNLSIQLKVEDRIFFIGNQENVIPVYCAADVLAMPSKSEASPLTLIEAQLCNLRCVISNGVPNESIVTKNVRKMDKNANYNDWAKALLDDNFIGNAVEKIEKYNIEYNIKILKECYLKYYNEGEKNV